MRLLPDKKLDYKDILVVPQRSDLDSRSEVQLNRNFKFRHCISEWDCVPIIASNMYNTGTLAMVESLAKYDMIVALHKYYDFAVSQKLPDIKHLDSYFITIGQSEEDLAKLALIRNLRDCIPFRVCVDVANGYRESFIEFIKRLRDIYKYEILIMAGNVTTPEITQELILAGADIVKIGIGPGSVCETRKRTKVGYPMVSAIIECADAAHGLGGHICADGGCKDEGDVVAAFCCGADFVMLGGMLAGTEECEGEWTEIMDYTKFRKCSLCQHIKHIPTSMTVFSCTCSINPYLNSKYLKFFGMSSYEAMDKFGGKDKEYRASEGKCELIPYKGPVENTVKEILGGLRGCGTLIGADQLKHFNKRATIIQI